MFYNAGNSTVPDFTGSYRTLYDSSGNTLLANMATIADFNLDGESHSLDEPGPLTVTSSSNHAADADLLSPRWMDVS